MVGVKELLEFPGRRKSIVSDSRSGILDNGQEKVIEKTTTKLSLMLAMFHVVRMADAMAIESNGWQTNRLRGNHFIEEKAIHAHREKKEVKRTCGEREQKKTLYRELK